MEDTMKSARKKTLALRKESLRSISTRDLATIAGGTLVVGPIAQAPAAGFIMKDSVIVRTGDP
jgi:hypothetical protein